MTIQDVQISDFTKGELSPRMKGRTDVAGYFSGLDTMLNMVTLPQGGAARRPGFAYVASVMDQTVKPRLRRFTFSTLQSYILEFGDKRLRFYMNDGQIFTGLVPTEIETVYAANELADLKFVQSDDELFIFHPQHFPATLDRFSHTDWTLNVVQFRDGPYFDVNGTDTTLTVSNIRGTISVEASSTVGINVSLGNTGQGFLASDVGRHIRIKLVSTWAWGIIAGWTDPLHITVHMQPRVPQGAFGMLDGAAWQADTDYPAGYVVTGGSGDQYLCNGSGVSGSEGPRFGTDTPVPDGTINWTYMQADPIRRTTPNWRLGKWGFGFGWPTVPIFWQQRLMALGALSQPNAIEGSVIGDFTNFAPTQSDGTVTDANAVSFIIDDDQVNAILWAQTAGAAQAAQLGIGTSGGEQIMSAGIAGTELSATNVQAYRETGYGSAANIDALRIGKAILFADRPGRRLREWVFRWQENGYIGPDLTQYSEHITASGIVALAYQQSPYSIVWAVLANGQLVGFTYDRDQQIFAAHRHRPGGQYYGGPPIVESIEVIPSPDGSYDELWAAVHRTVNGKPFRSVEVLTRYFENATVPAENAFFVDCGLATVPAAPNATLNAAGMVPVARTADLAPAWTGAGATPTQPGIAQFSASAAVFSSANVGAQLRIAGGVVLITAIVSGEVVEGAVLRPLNSLAPAPPGTWTLAANDGHVGGLKYLIGETVSLLGDGADMGDVSVPPSGSVPVAPGGATQVSAGLPYVSALVTMPFEPQRAAAPVAGRIKRIHHLFVRFQESLGCAFGRRSIDPMTNVPKDSPVGGEVLRSRTAADPMDQAPPLFTGSKRLSPQGGYDAEGQVFILQTRPLPMTVLSIGAEADVTETAETK